MTSADTAQLFWLASYPKSGNTWTRVFLANLLRAEPEGIDINQIDTGAIASGREWVQAAFDFDINEMDHDEVDKLRPVAYSWLSLQASEPEYHKTHDAYTYVSEGQPLFPVSATRGAVILVRNPLDVAVSYSHHNGEAIDRTITRLNNPEGAMCKQIFGLPNQLRQRMLSWSGFYRSWFDAPIAKCVVRYEDLHADPVSTFARITRFLAIDADMPAITEAVDKSSISSLQAQEAQKPFREKSGRAENFFRKGEVGDWKNHLSDEQVKSIINCHQATMIELGYLDQEMQPQILPLAGEDHASQS